MTTITFESDLDVKKKNFRDIDDFLSTLSASYNISYEESLEKKLKAVQSASSSDFVNL